MKILVTSVDALFDDTNKPYPGIIEALDTFKSLQLGNEVVVVSLHGPRLQTVPERFNPWLVDAQTRRVDLISKTIQRNPSFSYSDVVVLAAKRDDLILAANERVPLLTANYTPIDSEITQKYGIGIRDGQALSNFCENFLDYKNPWYYQLQVDSTTTLYSLIKAGDYQPADMATLFNHFQSCLKHGDPQYLDLFKTYFLMSCYSESTINQFRDVNFWGVYPSSSTALNQDLEYFKELARTSFNGKPRSSTKLTSQDRQLLIRTTPAEKRHYKSKQARLVNGCLEQLETIILNPRYRDQLKGATVCIIDDFTTYGTSCETTRLLMQQAGVAKLLFVTMGKFGQEYYSYNYKITGDPFTGVDAAIIGNPALVSGGMINSGATQEALSSLTSLL